MNDLLSLLKEELTALESATEILRYSYEICKKVGIKEQPTFDEMDRFEAFTNRFARPSDIIVQKICRLIDQIDLEDGGSVRDRINRAEKKD